MARFYLDPEDVGPVHARQVLDFLNSANTPEEIARRVEIAGEPDIGVRLAARILERRRELGRFVNLAQIAEIPLIGPERFTEIVVTLSGARAIAAVEPTVAELMRELNALRAQMATLQAAADPRPRVGLQALQETPYLGEGVNLVVQVTDASGTRPAVDVPVTMVATWGRLRAVDGTTLREGTSLVTRTDDVGMARALLFPPTSEELLPQQQAALQAALRLLDPKAATPREVEPALREIARQYRWHGYPQLRDAVDIYFRDFGNRLLETVNDRDYLAAWLHQEATVLALVRHDGDGGASGVTGRGILNGSAATAVDTSAALTLRIRNWLGAWLEMVQQIAEEEAHLADDLRGAMASEESGLLLSRVYTRVHDFIGLQRGVVGQYVGQRLAERSIRDFLQTGIAELPTSFQQAVVPALDVASRTLTTAGSHVMAAVGQTRTELRKEIDSRAGIDQGVLAEIASGLETVRSQLSSKADRTDLVAVRNELDARLATKLDVTTFTIFQQDVDTRFETRLPRAEFESFQSSFATVTRQIGTLDTSLRRLDQDVTALRTRG